MKVNAVVCTVATALLVAGCDASAPTSAKQMVAPSSIHGDAIVYTTNERDVPWSSTEPNPCNGDVVAITGTSHFIIHTGFDATGGLHYNANIVSRGTGVGTNITYKISDQFRDVEQVPAMTDGYVIRETGSLKVDGPQTADDYWSFVTFKVTVTATGVPTAVMESAYTKCGV